MIIHDHHDALLTETLTITDATEQTGGIIDICEPGGSETAHLVLTAEACDQSLTIQVKGCDTPDGEFTPVDTLIFTTTENEPFAWRDRVPLHCPQYITLSVRPAGAPGTPAAVTLRYAV